MKEHGVYKFVLKDTKEIVYIGKTNSSFQQRINAHIRAKGGDDKFKDYAYKCDIYVAKLPNSTETDLIERALINQYKPILNGTDNHKGMSQLIKIDEPKWEQYRFPKNHPIKSVTSKPKEEDTNILLFEDGQKNIYIYEGYSERQKGRKIKVNMYANADEAIDTMKRIMELCLYCGKRIGSYYVVDARHLANYKLVLKHIKQMDKLGWDQLHIKNGPAWTHQAITSCISYDKDKGKIDGMTEVKFFAKSIDIFEDYFANYSVKLPWGYVIEY